MTLENVKGNLKEIVQEALEDHLLEDTRRFTDLTLETSTMFCTSYMKGWLKGSGQEDKWTEDEIKNEVREFIKYMIIEEITRCIELSEDPFEFRNWVVIKGEY